MEITLSKKAAKYIEKQDVKVREILKKAILLLPKGDVKPFYNHDLVTHRLRVGDFRVLFYYKESGGLHIDRVGSRGDIYK